MILSDFESRDTRGQIFPAELHKSAHTFSPRTTTFDKVTTLGTGVFLEGQPCPIQGVGPSVTIL